MSDVIHSLRGFLKNFKVGDVFWHMTSQNTRPYGVEGPCEITEIFNDTRFNLPTVRYTQGDIKGDTIREKTIGDLTNRWHGVFLDSASAYAHLTARQVEYERMAGRQERQLDHLLALFGSM